MAGPVHRGRPTDPGRQLGALFTASFRVLTEPRWQGQRLRVSTPPHSRRSNKHTSHPPVGRCRRLGAGRSETSGLRQGVGRVLPRRRRTTPGDEEVVPSTRARSKQSQHDAVLRLPSADAVGFDDLYDPVEERGALAPPGRLQLGGHRWHVGRVAAGECALEPPHSRGPAERLTRARRGSSALSTSSRRSGHSTPMPRCCHLRRRTASCFQRPAETTAASRSRFLPRICHARGPVRALTCANAPDQ